MFDPSYLKNVTSGSTVSDLREPAFALISRIQDAHPGAQVRSLALALCVVCSEIGISAHDLVQQGYRMMADADGPYTIHIRALKDYAREELCRKPA